MDLYSPKSSAIMSNLKESLLELLLNSVDTWTNSKESLHGEFNTIGKIDAIEDKTVLKVVSDDAIADKTAAMPSQALVEAERLHKRLERDTAVSDSNKVFIAHDVADCKHC